LDIPRRHQDAAPKRGGVLVFTRSRSEKLSADSKAGKMIKAQSQSRRLPVFCFCAFRKSLTTNIQAKANLEKSFYLCARAQNHFFLIYGMGFRDWLLKECSLLTSYKSHRIKARQFAEIGFVL
jgi:hypothetical protein